MRLSRALVAVLAVSVLTLTACGNASKDSEDSKGTGGSGTESSTSDSASGGGCSSVPSKEDVESVIGSKVLPVEDQGTVGCAYLGDGNNVGVYFEIDTDQLEIDGYANPDPKFATLVEDPALPAGSFVQSGDFYAKKGDVLYKVVANVKGTEDDNELAKKLMIAWLGRVG
ncbi:MAG: hypothetical protein JWQ74_1097 [Marmoricola sp.]|nr:hypothetical protein [Marmoricola sp.]